MRIKRIFISVVTLVASLEVALADQVQGIYGCSGYYQGYSTNYKNVGLKMTLNIGADRVYMHGDYNFFGTNIKNPLVGVEYLNCGMEFPPEFAFERETCEIFKVGKGFIVQDFGKLDLATMRLTVFAIVDDASANFDCVKTQY